MKRQVIGMKERINRLAKGIIDSEQPKMTWSPEKIDETLRMNTLRQRNEMLLGCGAADRNKT